MKTEREILKEGFALVELLLAIAIFGILSAFLVIMYQKMSDQLFLGTASYEVGLTFRETQSYGVSVKQEASGEYDAGYGIHFDKGETNEYVRFADADMDSRIDEGYYDGDDAAGVCVSQTECLSVFRLGKGNKIAKFCGVLPEDKGRDASDALKAEECDKESTPPGSSTRIDFLDVSFKRPNPDAIIRTNQSTDDLYRYKSARIYLESPKGDRRVIEVVNTGQISIK